AGVYQVYAGCGWCDDEPPRGTVSRNPADAGVDMSVVAGGGAGVGQDDPQVGRLPLQRVAEPPTEAVVEPEPAAVAVAPHTFESALEAQEESALEARYRLAADEDPA